MEWFSKFIGLGNKSQLSDSDSSGGDETTPSRPTLPRQLEEGRGYGAVVVDSSTPSLRKRRPSSGSDTSDEEDSSIFVNPIERSTSRRRRHNHGSGGARRGSNSSSASSSSSRSGDESGSSGGMVRAKKKGGSPDIFDTLARPFVRRSRKKKRLSEGLRGEGGKHDIRSIMVTRSLAEPERVYLIRELGGEVHYVVHVSSYLYARAYALVTESKEWTETHKLAPLFAPLEMTSISSSSKRRRHPIEWMMLHTLLKIGELEARALIAQGTLREQVSLCAIRQVRESPSSHPVKQGEEMVSPQYTAPDQRHEILLPIKSMPLRSGGTPITAVTTQQFGHLLYQRSTTTIPSGSTGEFDDMVAIGIGKHTSGANLSDDEDSGDGKIHKHRLRRREEQKRRIELQRRIEADPQLKRFFSLPPVKRTALLLELRQMRGGGGSSGIQHRVPLSIGGSTSDDMGVDQLDEIAREFTKLFEPRRSDNNSSSDEDDGYSTSDEADEQQVSLRHLLRPILGRRDAKIYRQSLRMLAKEFGFEYAAYCAWFKENYLTLPGQHWIRIELHAGAFLSERITKEHSHLALPPPSPSHDLSSPPPPPTPVVAISPFVPFATL